MGCCFSTGDRHSETERRGALPTSSPAVLEEETVKEVLLETPVVTKVDERIKGMPIGDLDWKVEVGPTAAINGDLDLNRKADEEIVSEVSEMCSYSESFSNATAQEKKEDDEDGVVNQRPPMRKRRGPGGGRGRGERVVARRTAAPSPERRGQVAPLRPVRGRVMQGQQRDLAEENGRRRESGEGSGLRPRSPVKRIDGDLQRNVSDEKSTASREPQNDVVTREPQNDVVPRKPPNDVVAADEAESLENPVVSLECFIFL